MEPSSRARAVAGSTTDAKHLADSSEHSKKDRAPASATTGDATSAAADLSDSDDSDLDQEIFLGRRVHAQSTTTPEPESESESSDDSDISDSDDEATEKRDQKQAARSRQRTRNMLFVSPTADDHDSDDELPGSPTKMPGSPTDSASPRGIGEEASFFRKYAAQLELEEPQPRRLPPAQSPAQGTSRLPDDGRDELGDELPASPSAATLDDTRSASPQLGSDHLADRLADPVEEGRSGLQDLREAIQVGDLTTVSQYVATGVDVNWVGAVRVRPQP